MQALTTNHFCRITTTGRQPLLKEIRGQFQEEFLMDYNPSGNLDAPAFCRAGSHHEYFREDGTRVVLRGLVILEGRL
jgi:hypothetical protein